MIKKFIKYNIIKKGSTNILRLAIFFIGLGVLALCIFALPEMRNGSKEFPVASRAIFLIMIGLYASVIPFFIALLEALKLLSYIDNNKAFSDLSVKALRKIKYSASIIAILYVGGVPLLLPIAQADDAPGLIIMGMVIASAPIVVAVFAGVLEKLLQNAIDIKSENDLTV